MRKIVYLTSEEDALYSKLMGNNLNLGLSDNRAERETINELKSKFPRLKTLLTGKYKIALNTKN